VAILQKIDRWPKGLSR